jgi:hypothetical protein
MLFGWFVGTLLLRLRRNARSQFACIALAGFGSGNCNRLVRGD